MPPSALALPRLAYACTLHNRASPGLIYLRHAADLGVFGRARIAVLIRSGGTNIRFMEFGVPAPLRICIGRIDTDRRLAEGPKIQISSIALYEVDDTLARPAPEATCAKRASFSALAARRVVAGSLTLHVSGETGAVSGLLLESLTKASPMCQREKQRTRLARAKP